MQVKSSEQEADREDVWRQVAEHHPEFKREYDIANNHHAVREIVLGGSVPWKGVHAHFKPAKGMQVLDIGANTGVFSAYCAANGADVVAYEAHPVVFALLEKMVAQSKLPIRPIHAAVWTQWGQMPFLGHTSDTEWCERYNGSLPTEGIMWTPDDQRAATIVRSMPFADVLGYTEKEWSMVKVDIEGAEFDLFLFTPEEALRRIKFCYLELHPWVSQTTYDRTIERLERIFRFEGAWRSIDGRWEAVYLWRK